MAAIPFIVSNVKNVLAKYVSTRTSLLLAKPYQVSIEPTLRCNARCLMCDSWKVKKDYLTDTDILRILAELKSWMGNHFFVQIAGGEPLVFKGIYRIFRYCSDNHIICKISTNGIALNKKTCHDVIDSGLKYLTVSIDSHIPEVHDKYRGVQGAFTKALWGMKYLREHSSIVLGVSAIIMKENVHQIKELTDFFLSLDIDRVLFQPVRAYGFKPSEWKKYPYWIKDLDALADGIAYIKKMKRKDGRIMNTTGHLNMMIDYFKDPMLLINQQTCSIGFEQVTVNYRGDVYLCDQLPSIGNIKDLSLPQIWHSEKAQDIRKKMVQCKIPCTSNCKKELSFREKIDKFYFLSKAGLFE